MVAKPLRTKLKRASAERYLRPLGATMDMTPPTMRTSNRFSEEGIFALMFTKRQPGYRGDYWVLSSSGNCWHISRARPMRWTMRDDNLSVSAGRLAALECRVRWYQRLTLALGLGLVLGVSLAAQTVPSVADVLRARRLEVVDEAGKVGFTAYAQVVGGRIDVLNS